MPADHPVSGAAALTLVCPIPLRSKPVPLRVDTGLKVFDGEVSCQPSDELLLNDRLPKALLNPDVTPDVRPDEIPVGQSEPSQGPVERLLFVDEPTMLEELSEPKAEPIDEPRPRDEPIDPIIGAAILDEKMPRSALVTFDIVPVGRNELVTSKALQPARFAKPLRSNEAEPDASASAAVDSQDPTAEPSLAEPNMEPSAKPGDIACLTTAATGAALTEADPSTLP